MKELSHTICVKIETAGGEEMENKSNFTATEAKNLLWEHIKMLSEEAKKEHTAEGLDRLTSAICNALLALFNM